VGEVLFVTGTDTDVGKTYISALLAKKMKANYYKPVLSGAKWVNGRLIAMDAKFVLDECRRGEIHPNDCVSYLFEETCSPHLASCHANIAIELKKIREDYQNVKKKSDYLVVEGAGGLICPLKEDELMLIDVIKELTLPIVIVSNSHLGAINQVMLTVEYARSQGIKIAGIMMNHFVKGDLICEDNLKMIEKLSGIQVIDTVAKGQKELAISAKKLTSFFEK
jgi:dethiobiotin synthetase